MSAATDSFSDFLGTGNGGPKVGTKTSNQALGELSTQNAMYSIPEVQKALNDYAQGKISSNQALSTDVNDPQQKSELANALATGAATGSRFASDQVQNDPILASLFGQGGQLNKSEGILDKLNNQGFQLTPDDQTMYGQMSGNIARQFGQQGNQIASDLASRGLSSSGAAGAAFSGLAGNQNEMLAQAQQQIAQQRFQNTMQQIGQQQQFINSLGNTANSAIQNQYGRQLAGANFQKGGLETEAGLENQTNSLANNANLQAAQFEQENKPGNFMDSAIGGFNSAIGAAGKSGGQKAGSSLFGQAGGGATPPPVAGV